MSSIFDDKAVRKIGDVLNDVNKLLSERFRALFTLRSVGDKRAVDCIAPIFTDQSALLKHECAYCLGQMQDKHAIPVLQQVLEDTTQEPIVRHEAGEALGAIGCEEALPCLMKYTDDASVEVAQTCQLAIQRIRWFKENSSKEENLPDNPYKSVDPAPPAPLDSIEKLEAMLVDEERPLFERYRAMFTLRNIGTDEAISALAKGLNCSGALLRHEVAYVLGQAQNPTAVESLHNNLQNLSENCMVRHECAEALGSIATAESMLAVKNYSGDSERVVRESCEVAIDMAEYEQSGQFQYADTLLKINN